MKKCMFVFLVAAAVAAHGETWYIDAAAAELQYGRNADGRPEASRAPFGPHGQGLRLHHALRYAFAAISAGDHRTTSAQMTGEPKGIETTLKNTKEAL